MPEDLAFRLLVAATSTTTNVAAEVGGGVEVAPNPCNHLGQYDRDARANGYQNKLFEFLNQVSNMALFVDFSGVGRTADEAAMGNTQDIVGEAAQFYSELFGLMAQERQMVEPLITQLIDNTFKVPT